VTNDELIALFSKPPASFVWSPSEDGRRTIGVAEGAALDIWPDHIDLAAIFPSDRPDLAARSGDLMQLLLMAMRPNWQSAAAWLAQQMKLAAWSKLAIYETLNVTRQVSFTLHRRTGQAVLKVLRAE
jgi:hypothetical protein